MDAQGRRHVSLQWAMLILFLIISSFCTNSSLISATPAEKVTLELYYETLCPYCSNLIVNYLNKIFDTGLIEITNLKLIPYGNAKIRPNSTIACQSSDVMEYAVYIIIKGRDHTVQSDSRIFAFDWKPKFQYTTMNFKLQSHMLSTFHMNRIYLLLFLLFLALVSPISCKEVSLGVYYESLCPYSAHFVVEELSKIFYDGLIYIVDLHLVPWGNARVLNNGTFECQHGPYECLLNTIEACAIDVWPDVNVHFPFIYCVEKLVYEGKKTEWETCFEKLSLDEKPVTDCYVNGRGKELELGYASVTNDLQPPHEYVPWVTVDGQPLYDDYTDFISYICKAYKGTPVPSACSGLSAVEVSNRGNVNIFTPVCYTGVTIMSILSGITSAITSLMQGVTEAALE